MLKCEIKSTVEPFKVFPYKSYTGWEISEILMIDTHYLYTVSGIKGWSAILRPWGHS